MVALQLLAFCRAGFEQECRLELEAVIAETGRAAAGAGAAGSGYVTIQPEHSGDGGILLEKISFRHLVFSRHLVAVAAEEVALTPGDRIEGLRDRLKAMTQWIGPFSDVWLGWPDAEAGRVLAPLCHSLDGRLGALLREEGIWVPEGGGVRGEVVFLSGTRAMTGYSLPYNSSRWPMGLPRLRLPPESPSRSALKLEEALVTFANEAMTPRAGQTAVDLGAAPGGWTWSMVRRGIKVTAVDRGALAAPVLASPLVRHVREDGFRFQPHPPADWLLCDIVDQPRRVADLIARWGSRGWCRGAVFNLKLPMKKRWEEVQLCRERMVATLRQAGIPFHLYLRQLYHDREEVTGVLNMINKKKGFPPSRE
ncbi:MAG: 23S rRNA (cytidine(2498)-2'-O)-methyltransferase RlmM [Magnetococcales bacterium]|nr:23S rRNA (cytidine(2498)-2'-O)-methyltransferase RlmM [Magnetococcales bacterium]